ncbi:uncharacterized protein LOC123297827 [Chrysoperla carnea]|uniref:uncharacterized protein LOC123297827 n=1 Tax=Chrysoperla carnea TaxID=189513 RepID=UPI001D05FBDE|nr:uncharacterized protein LOC123297827 [Chrysoperla carnea]
METGISDINTLLKSMTPELSDAEYVFTTISYKENLPDVTFAIGMFKEREGTTFIFPKDYLPSSISSKFVVGNFRMISLNVHSSLQAVGLTAAISKSLADKNISANIIAGFYHDHIFVPTDRASEAMEILKCLQERSS